VRHHILSCQSSLTHLGAKCQCLWWLGERSLRFCSCQRLVKGLADEHRAVRKVNTTRITMECQTHMHNCSTVGNGIGLLLHIDQRSLPIEVAQTRTTLRGCKDDLFVAQKLQRPCHLQRLLLTVQTVHTATACYRFGTGLGLSRSRNKREQQHHHVPCAQFACSGRVASAWEPSSATASQALALLCEPAHVQQRRTAEHSYKRAIYP
jgi:hypothetical protein